MNNRDRRMLIKCIRVLVCISVFLVIAKLTNPAIRYRLQVFRTGRDTKAEVEGDQQRFPIITAQDGAVMTRRLEEALNRREDHLASLLQQQKDKIAALEGKATAYRAALELEMLAKRKESQIESERVLVNSYERQLSAIHLLRTEIENGDVELELAQLRNTHTALVVKDVSHTIREADARLPDFSNDDAIALAIIEGLAPAIFDRKTSQVEVHEIVLIGLPNVLNPNTRQMERVVAYKYRYPYSRARLVIDWDETASGNEVEALLRPTVLSL